MERTRSSEVNVPTMSASRTLLLLVKYLHVLRRFFVFRFKWVECKTFVTLAKKWCWQILELEIDSWRQPRWIGIYGGNNKKAINIRNDWRWRACCRIWCRNSQTGAWQIVIFQPPIPATLIEGKWSCSLVNYRQTRASPKCLCLEQVAFVNNH